MELQNYFCKTFGISTNGWVYRHVMCLLECLIIITIFILTANYNGICHYNNQRFPNILNLLSKTTSKTQSKTTLLCVFTTSHVMCHWFISLHFCQEPSGSSRSLVWDPLNYICLSNSSVSSHYLTIVISKSNMHFGNVDM